MDMYQRYSRNLPAISRQEQELLHKKRVLVAGCGGLGGYITENLLRLGIGHITAVDGDSFDVSNLNRQLLATEATIGKSKAEAAKERAALVNPSVEFMAIGKYITPENAADTIAGHNIVIDALDSASARLLLEDACAQADIPLIHGAVCGWCCQYGVSMPGSGLLHRIYSGAVPKDNGVLPFVPPFCAALQCTEAAKLLTGRQVSANKLYIYDFCSMDFEVINL